MVLQPGKNTFYYTQWSYNLARYILLYSMVLQPGKIYSIILNGLTTWQDTSILHSIIRDCLSCHNKGDSLLNLSMPGQILIAFSFVLSYLDAKQKTKLSIKH